MSGMTWLRIGALLGALGVTAGAFGAHGLEKTLDARALDVWETASKYQMYHALALLAVGLLALHGRSANLAGWSFLLGTLIFSGSLYALALTGIRQLGMITPIGGVFLILGWLCLAFTSGTAAKASSPDL